MAAIDVHGGCWCSLALVAALNFDVAVLLVVDPHVIVLTVVRYVLFWSLRFFCCCCWFWLFW